MNDYDHKWMELALLEANESLIQNEVPVGAVIVQNGVLIASAHNAPITTHNPIAHAEILAIEKAGKQLKTDRLDGCEIYVTLQPCNMCISAINLAKIKKVVYALEQEVGVHSYLLENPKLEVFGGVMREAAQKLLQQFFQNQRVMNKRAKS